MRSVVKDRTHYVLTDLGTSVPECQVCGEHCTQAWRQAEEIYTLQGALATWVKIDEMTGHLGCLELQQNLASIGIGSPAWYLAQFGYTVSRVPRPGRQFGSHREIKGPQGEVIMRDPTYADVAELINQLMTEALACAT